MPYRKTQLSNGEIYHTIIRRIEGNLLFADTDDYFRGIFSIYEFNNANPVEIKKQRDSRLNGDRVSFGFIRDRLVEILAFCLMPNHIHLLLRQLKDGGITKFMNKFGAGYPAYFRRKHSKETGSPSADVNSKGYFFQGRFASVHIDTEKQLKTVFAYIHTNPILLIEPGWKGGEIKDYLKAVEFLENYRWSSYLDYVGKNNFPSVIDRDFFSNLLGGKEECKKFITEWIKYKQEVGGLVGLTLEK